MVPFYQPTPPTFSAALTHPPDLFNEFIKGFLNRYVWPVVGLCVCQHYARWKNGNCWQNPKPDVGCAAKMKNGKPKKKMCPMPSAPTDKSLAHSSSKKRNRNTAIEPKSVECVMPVAQPTLIQDPRGWQTQVPKRRTPNNTESKHYKHCHALASKTAPKKLPSQQDNSASFVIITRPSSNSFSLRPTKKTSKSVQSHKKAMYSVVLYVH